MPVPNPVAKFALERAGAYVGGPVGAATAGMSATTAFATESLANLAEKIQSDSVRWSDITSTTAALEAALYSQGVLQGALGVGAAPGALIGGLVVAGGIFAAYYRNPTAALDAGEAIYDAWGQQPWKIIGDAAAACSKEIEREKRAAAVSPNLGDAPDPLVKTIRYVDPLILDLDGDGLEITPLNQQVLFDANGDGIKTATAWASADDGLVVWDRNGNGTIDTGAELFGDQTVLADGTRAPDGFAALSDLDSNRDGSFKPKISEMLHSLRVGA